ncbi:MAG: class I SAM-dependent methyltransferase [Leptolyngbyaceae cyanobacterium]
MNRSPLQQKQHLFDQWAPSYDWLLPTVFYQAIHQRLLEFIQLPDHPQVLDLGCGTGRLLNRLADRFPDLMGTGLDFSPQMIRQARQTNHHHPRLIFVEGDVEALPFVAGQFDAIVNTISFLHYLHPDRVLSEVHRVLRHNCPFYLVDFAASRWQFDTVQITLPGNIHFYSPRQREQMGYRAGFQGIRHQYLLGPVLLTKFLKA